MLMLASMMLLVPVGVQRPVDATAPPGDVVLLRASSEPRITISRRRNFRHRDVGQRRASGRGHFQRAVDADRQRTVRIVVSPSTISLDGGDWSVSIWIVPEVLSTLTPSKVAPCGRLDVTMPRLLNSPPAMSCSRASAKSRRPPGSCRNYRR